MIWRRWRSRPSRDSPASGMGDGADTVVRAYLFDDPLEVPHLRCGGGRSCLEEDLAECLGSRE